MAKKSDYPRIKSLGLIVHDQPVPHVNHAELRMAVASKLGVWKWRTFCRLFGIQTQITEGPYASDVESTLERMMTGRLTGSQLCWD